MVLNNYQEMDVVMDKPIVIVLSDKLRKLDRYLIMKHTQSRSSKDDVPAKIFDDWLNKQENVSLPNNVVLRFTTLKDGFSSLLSASAHLPYYIIASPEWAARLFLFDSEATRNAFTITIGHEITHIDGDFPNTKLTRNDKKFVNWVNEVHADFGAAEKMVEYNRQKLIGSMQYKMDAKKEPRCKLLNKFTKKVLNLLHSDEYTHPSWETRLEYATNYDFDENLIKRIATETDCTNDVLIKKICAYYKPIVLKQNIV